MSPNLGGRLRAIKPAPGAMAVIQGADTAPLNSGFRSVRRTAFVRSGGPLALEHAQAVTPVTALPSPLANRQHAAAPATNEWMTDIDWATELRRIEREFDGLPPEPTPAQVRARRAAEAREKERQAERVARRGTWARLALVIALSVSTLLWPYARDCGLGLAAYGGAVAMIVLGALWVTSCTWRLRMARTHGVALLLALWGLMLLGDLILPRVGYAAIDPANPPAWFCR